MQMINETNNFYVTNEIVEGNDDDADADADYSWREKPEGEEEEVGGRSEPTDEEDDSPRDVGKDVLRNSMDDEDGYVHGSGMALVDELDDE